MTDASHVPREENLARMISIPRRYRPERTRSLSLRGANRGRCCDFSKDREGRAKFGYLAVIYHLPGDLSIFRWQWQHQDITDVLISPYCSPFHVGFLTLSQVRHWFAAANKTYEEPPGLRHRMLFHLAGRALNGQ